MMANKRGNIARLRRKVRVRKKVQGTDERPRICVFRSNKHVYAQVISDNQGVTLVVGINLVEGLAWNGQESTRV